MPNPEPKTILLVDDDRELNDALRAVLEKRGYVVFQAGNGFEARQGVVKHRPDLVILDMMMPRMGGFPVLEHFRDQVGTPPIIMITGNEGSRHKAYAEWLGVADYLRKPFPVERLLESVDRNINGADRPGPASSKERGDEEVPPRR